MLKLFDERITNSYRLVKDAKLESRKLMLRGKLDYALLGRTDAFPIEVKYGSTPIRYKSQLVSYSMLIEDGLDLKSTIGYFVYSYSLSRPKVYAVGITEEDKEQVRKELFNIRNDIKKGTRPEPTSLQEKCVFCEFRNFCDDVF
ncbi:MAG: hypothetical protein BK997_03325 [Candidatus Micrarchaeum sp. ARMAN-1]|nr:MAG: hypothetical protein BK997_03325 [Candidatus Micrarchaeum sp. ARMAN-1]